LPGILVRRSSESARPTIQEPNTPTTVNTTVNTALPMNSLDVRVET